MRIQPSPRLGAQFERRPRVLPMARKDDPLHIPPETLTQWPAGLTCQIAQVGDAGAEVDLYA